MSGTALILGGSGRFGRHMATALWNSGWRIRHFDRARDDLLQAAQGADIIVNGWNPPYHKWQAELPGQTDAIIAAARASGARIVQGANVYVFGEGNGGAFGPDHPHRATNPLGRVRIEMERKLRDSGLPLLILRSGDYLDTEASGNWFDRLITQPLAKGRIAYPGDPEVPHAWAFLPDVARIGASLLARDDLPHQLEVATADHTLSGRDMATALGALLGREMRVTPFAWWQLHLLRPVMPILGGNIEMRYLWSLPHWMDDSAWRAWCPGFQRTPLKEALAQCPPVSDLVASPDQPRPARDGSPARRDAPAPAK